jgi:hypothetical protein
MKRGALDHPTPHGDKEFACPKLEKAPMPMGMESEADEDLGSTSSGSMGPKHGRAITWDRAHKEKGSA